MQYATEIIKNKFETKIINIRFVIVFIFVFENTYLPDYTFKQNSNQRGYMFKNIFLLSLLCLIFTQCITPSASIKREKKPQDSFLPQQLYPLYLGMPMREFDEIKKHTAARINQDSIMDFRIEKKEAYADKLMYSVIYYFDAEKNNPLYESFLQK